MFPVLVDLILPPVLKVIVDEVITSGPFSERPVYRSPSIIVMTIFRNYSNVNKYLPLNEQLNNIELNGICVIGITKKFMEMTDNNPPAPANSFRTSRGQNLDRRISWRKTIFSVNYLN